MATKTAKKAPVKKVRNNGKAKPAKKATAKAKQAKAPGVIFEIKNILAHGGGTIDEIAAKLAKAFPNRNADGMKVTVKAQVNRLPANGFKINKTREEGSREVHYSAG